MKIRQLSTAELRNAIPFVWKVFCEFEGANYSESGKTAFYQAINSEEYLRQLSAFGAFEKNELLGIIATRNGGSHVALFFVEGTHQKQGIGKLLWNTVLAQNTADAITVHSSLYAAEVYKSLDFVQTDKVREENGIRYVPMEYRMTRNESCPCSRKKCIRHGRCSECRAHHFCSGRKLPCEKENP